MPHLDYLFASIAKGELNRLIALLKKHSTHTVNATEEEGISLLHYAVLQDKPDIVIYLVNNPECKLTPQDNHYGHTPLHMACFHDNSRIAQHLLAKLNSKEVNTQDKFGWTPLHHAARVGNLDLCKLLVKYYAKLDIRNELGKTALHYAAQHGFLDILKHFYESISSSVTPSLTECFALPVLTLLHLAALNDHQSIIEWLKHILYPSNVKCQRAVHQNGEITIEELAEDTAAARGHSGLKANLLSYRQQYESWIQDICHDHAPLNHVKLCLCGPPDSGKTSLSDALERSNLQLLLGWEPDVTTEGERKKKYTYGIDTKDIHISGHDTFHIWDFSGDIESFITYHYFLTTDHTMYIIVLDLRHSLPELRSELAYWLSLIKMHNLGQTPPYDHRPRDDSLPMSLQVQPRAATLGRSRTISVPVPSTLRSRIHSASSTLKPLSKFSQSVSPVDPARTPSHSSPIELANLSPLHLSSPVRAELPLSSLCPVPVLIVGSHFDLLVDSQRSEVISQFENCIRELSTKFHSSVDVIPQLFPVNCHKPNSSEIKHLKEQITAVRITDLENQLLYPRIFEKIIKKIESLKLQTPNTKVMKFNEMCSLIKTHINQLVSDRQITYILKCLSQIGMIIYIEHGALNQWVFIDPSWLCQDVLGQALAPPTYPSSLFTSYQSHMLTESQITSKLEVCTDRYFTCLALDLLHQFEVCHKSRNNDVYQFPSFITKEMDVADDRWRAGPPFVAYIGRRLSCADETDFFPPGFFPRLQVQICSLSSPKDLIHLYHNSLIIDATKMQCQVKLSPDNRSVDFIGRVTDLNAASSCLQMIDHIQSLMATLSRQLCPSVFFQWSILSAKNLQDHSPSLEAYSVTDIIEASHQSEVLWNNTLRCSESVDDLMYMGDEKLKKKCAGRGAKVTFLHDEIFEKLEILLSDDQEQAGWKQLAKHLNLSEYIELLKDHSEPAKRLILKWGEKPRWTVDSLLYALQGINRKDIYNFIRAKTDTKYTETECSK